MWYFYIFNFLYFFILSLLQMYIKNVLTLFIKFIIIISYQVNTLVVIYSNTIILVLIIIKYALQTIIVCCITYSCPHECSYEMTGIFIIDVTLLVISHKCSPLWGFICCLSLLSKSSIEKKLHSTKTSTKEKCPKTTTHKHEVYKNHLVYQ